MGFAHVSGQSASGTTTSGTTCAVTLTSNPTTGNVVCLAILYFSGGASGTTISGIVDGNSNAYTVTGQSPSTYDGNAGQIFLAYLLSAPANAHKTITVTFNNTIGGAAAVWADEFSVSGGTAGFDHDGKTTGSNAINGPTITVTGSSELVYSGAADSSDVGTAGGSWVPNTNQFGCNAAYIASVSANTALNWSGGGTWSSMGMSFTFTASGATHGLFKPSPVTGIGTGGPFFPNPIGRHSVLKFARRDRIFVPSRFAFKEAA